MEANKGHLPSNFGYKQMQGWKVINRYRVVQVNLHIWPHLTFDLLMWPLTLEYHGGQHRASTIQVWLQTDAGLESYQPLYRVLQVNLHIWPHFTFDLLMWPLTTEYHGGQYRASTNQVWLQADAGLESYSSFCKLHGRTDGRTDGGQTDAIWIP